MLIEPMIFEQWKEIDFFSIKKGQYLISNFGRVYSSNVISRVLCPAISNGTIIYRRWAQKNIRYSYIGSNSICIKSKS